VGAALVTGSGLSLGNDEPIAAHLWGLPSLLLVGLLAIPFSAIVAIALRQTAGNRRHKAVQVLGLGGAMLAVGMPIGNVLDPWLFPRR